MLATQQCLNVSFLACFLCLGLYRENAIAIESEASDFLTYYGRIDQSGCVRKGT